MAGWTHDDLDRIGTSEELELASRRRDGSLRGFVTMWVIRSGGDLYVRSAHGPDNPWYRRAVTTGVGTIRAGGVERDVTFAGADSGVHDTIDAAYHAKYDQYGPKIVGAVVGADAHEVTIRLVPLVPPKET
ncbi:MAG: DUF2255 family protein [Acidimicrobiia bacterium]